MWVAPSNGQQSTLSKKGEVEPVRWPDDWRSIPKAHKPSFYLHLFLTTNAMSLATPHLLPRRIVSLELQAKVNPSFLP